MASTSTMANLLQRQELIADCIRKMETNIKKDSAHRKTAEYIEKRVELIAVYMKEFEENHSQLQKSEDKTAEYFTSDAYGLTRSLYERIIILLRNTNPYTADINTAKTEDRGGFSKSDELISQQQTNFRAFLRVIRNIDIINISEKWEILDKLQALQSRWNVIDQIHWQIDNLLIGADLSYEEDFTKYEEMYEDTKRHLNRKLNSATSQYQATPTIEIPTFSGNYIQWPTFMDLYSQAIHNNNMLSKSQKMQHLKGKLRGEAERLVQHLNISEDNYDTCWELLTHRYNNLQLLFTKQIQVFMGQPSITKVTSYELKRLHDVSLETIHAIHNLGVNTDTWDPIIVHILTEKLDPDTYASYMESRKEPRNLPSFDELINFLESKFTALEPVNRKIKSSTTKQEVGSGHQKEPMKQQRYPNYNNNKSPLKTYTSTVKHTPRVCPMCKSSHILIYCPDYQNLSAEEKIKKINELNICKNCLFCHNAQKCNSNKTCKLCNKSHHTTLHDLVTNKQFNNMHTKSVSTISQPTASHVCDNFNEILLSTIELMVKAADGTYIRLRCLLDQGSQVNLITESAAQRLGIQRRKQDATISGIGISSNKCRGTIQLECKSLYSDYVFLTEAKVMTKMLNNLPNYTFEKQDWAHLQNICLADPSYNISRPVDILLDASIYTEIIMDGILRSPNNAAPIAQQTKLGWVLLGNVKTFNCHAVLNNVEEISQFWEAEEINDHDMQLSSEDDYCETLYKTTTRRRSDGRYEVKIPMKPNFEALLGPSKPQAIAQFRQLEKRLERDATLCDAYKKFIQEYIQLEHMKKCITTSETSFFLPHHGVIKPDSTTTKLRTVFNGSQKTKSGYSLNELMFNGPNLQQDLLTIIIRWRSYQFVYTADIEKFYRQVLIQEEDQPLQKIVWRDDNNQPIQEYQLCTVTYGTKAAPYLAMRTVKQLITDDGSKYPLAADILEHQLYVDDLLGGHNHLQQAMETQKQLIDILNGAGFNLRKWASNDDRLLQNLQQDQISQNMLDFKCAQTNKTLGITWNPHTDNFVLQAKNITATVNKNDVITKRSLLSDLSKLYDPLGWLSPTTMKGKLIFQQVWKLECSWDDALPQHLQDQWRTFRDDTAVINNITIPRWVGNTQNPIELHGFCDASERGYACVIYCKTIDNEGNINIRLLAGKTKLAPLNKNITLPRLELCGAWLLSRLMRIVIESFKSQKVTIHGWTDSTVVLGWIQGEVSRWRTFVANRVTKILDIIPAACWRHVRSDDNAADCASRGLLPSQLKSHTLWWEGPAWLKEKILPSENQTYETPTVETKRKQTYAVQTSSSIIESILNKHSSVGRVQRILAWVSRFINRARRNNKANCTTYLQLSELENARHFLIKHVQGEHFSEDIEQLRKMKNISPKSRLLNLYPFLDMNGIIRVGGRLQQSELIDSKKHPVILPNKNKLTNLLIDEAHNHTLHGGMRLTLTYIRNKYWILRGIRTVKEHLLKCVRCRRYKATKNNQLMAELPKSRVTPSRPFTHAGVDFTGQVDVKANKGRGIKTTKGYIAIFICLATKAVHLELVSDLTTASFLAALKRLCARRGTPKHIYSDNGTNFVGAARILNREYKEALQHYINIELVESATNLGITWHFNAPAWPSAGGIWESAVRSMKHHLRRVLGEQKLTFEEFITLLSQIEACLNSRPLIAVTDDVDDLHSLTPGHFLVGGPVLAPPISSDLEPGNIRTRWQLTEKMYKDFWKQWANEYLNTLQTRNKWHYPNKNLEVGDVVLMKEDQTPPARWPMARVTETHPGTDGRIRVVTLKTRNGFAKRPITKLTRMLPDEQDDLTPETNNCNKPQPNKTCRKKGLNSFFVTLLCFLVTFVPSSAQQTTNITKFSTGKLVYFDKVSDMQIAEDHWNLLIYYNMTTYWQSIDGIEKYITHLNSLCRGQPAFHVIATQFEHEVKELKHFNEILQSEHGKRVKRGLLDGVGYVANSLFGVLDGRFAEKYSKDIKHIQSNQKHLLNLYQQHTSIIEGEYNLLKRNEDVMSKQFQIITDHMKKSEQDIKEDQNHAAYITATALAINVIISNTHRVQQQLLDLVTEVRNGHMDTHLLTPAEFQEQLNIITGHLPRDLSLPCLNTEECIRTMYKMSRVSVRVTNKFLMIEVKLPIVSKELYELNRVLPIQQTDSDAVRTIITSSEYMAINIRKDLLIPMDYNDMRSCVQVINNQLICSLNLPIHDIKAASICEAQIINNRAISNCRIAIRECRQDWIKLHTRGAWLYTCCEECNVRIFCPAGAITQTLRHSGIITIPPGCTLKGNNIIIHSQNNFRSELKTNDRQEVADLPQESEVNQIINEANTTYFPENHEESLKTIKRKIDYVKVQQETVNTHIDRHETHHYITYGVLTAIIVTLLCICGVRYIKKRCQQRGSLELSSRQQAGPVPTPQAEHHQQTPRRQQSRRQSLRITSPQDDLDKLYASIKPNFEDKATSPT